MIKINIFSLTNIQDFEKDNNLYKIKNSTLINEIDNYIQNLEKEKNFTFRSWPEIYKFLKIYLDWAVYLSKSISTNFFYYDELKEQKLINFFNEYNYQKFRKKT